MNYLRQGILIFNYFCMIYTLLISVVYVIMIGVSFFALSKNRKRQKNNDYYSYINSENMIPISILVPAYNEEKNIVTHLTELMTLNYHEYELIVINDGSEDETHERITSHFGLYRIDFPLKQQVSTKQIKGIYYNPDYPNLLYVDKENGGKADALNAGINVSKYPLFACLDADSILEKDSLIRLSMEFMQDTDVIAAGGIVRIANGAVIENGVWKSMRIPKNNISCFQIVEYFRAFLSGRVSWGSTNSMLIISGAFGVFNKRVVIECGGYLTDTIGEDMEIIVHLHEFMRRNKRKYKIKFSSDPVCWTQGPLTLKDLRSQRRRWQIGLMHSLLLYKRMFLNPKYGFVGLVTMPYFWIFELFGPVVETLGYIVIPLSFLYGELSFLFLVSFLLLANFLGIIISLGGIILEQLSFDGYLTFKQCFNLTKFALVENLGFRQIVTIFRLEGMLRFRRLGRTWGKIKRFEFNKEE